MNPYNSALGQLVVPCMAVIILGGLLVVLVLAMRAANRQHDGFEGK